MQTRRTITVVGCHAEGEVGDVIIGGVLPPAGASMYERMRTMERDHDHIRKLLICEPRGSVARHVNLITPAIRPDCDAGIIIMEPTEYPPMSGSNSMCAATVLRVLSGFSTISSNSMSLKRHPKTTTNNWPMCRG